MAFLPVGWLDVEILARITCAPLSHVALRISRSPSRSAELQHYRWMVAADGAVLVHATEVLAELLQRDDGDDGVNGPPSTLSRLTSCGAMLSQ